MKFALIHLYLLLVPGFVLTMLLGIRRQQILFTITFSFAALIALVSIARNNHWSFDGLILIYAALPGVLLVLMALVYRQGFAIQGHSIRALLADRAGIAGLAVVTTGYLLWYGVTGPYTEVPADLYRHLEFTRQQIDVLQSGNFGPPLTLGQLATQQGGFWYVLIAFAVTLSDASVIDTLYPVMLVGGLLFVVATYSFCVVLFAPLNLTPAMRRLAAVITCFFVAAQMGVNAFSFVRYYGYAPALLNAIVVMAAMLCAIEIVAIVRQRQAARSAFASSLNTLALFLTCSAVALAMHRQEAVFIGVMVVSLIAWLFVDALIRRARGRWFGYLVAAVVSSLVWLAAFALLTRMFDGAAIPQSDSGKVLALPFEWPGFGPLHVLNPGFQFAEVVTIWGLAVLVGFVVWFRFFRAQPLLVAGMISPLLTVFNPFFVDLFLRVEDDHSLWRLCFLMPLYPVAALVMVRAMARWDVSSGVAKAGSLLLAISLCVLPFMTPLNRYVRTTNFPVAEHNSYHIWQDALDYLNTLPGRERVLTDPVTGYVVSGLTAHRTFRYKFLASDLYQAFRFAFDSYDDAPLSKYRGWLILVNRRDGAHSNTGLRTGHWPADIMRVSAYYPDALLRHLDAHTDRFEILWSADQIALYRIRR